MHFGALNYEKQHTEGTCKVSGRSVVFSAFYADFCLCPKLLIITTLKGGINRVGFLDETLPICYKEYVEKAEGDTVRMRAICQTYNYTRIAFCSIWEATPFKTNTLP